MSKVPNAAETVTVHALEFLKGHWNEIVEFYPTTQNGELDRMHIDVLVLLRSGLALQLQVKSVERAAEKHRRRFPYIPVVVVQHNDTIRDVAIRIKNIIEERYLEIQKREPITISTTP